MTATEVVRLLVAADLAFGVVVILVVLLGRLLRTGVRDGPVDLPGRAAGALPS